MPYHFVDQGELSDEALMQHLREQEFIWISFEEFESPTAAFAAAPDLSCVVWVKDHAGDDPTTLWERKDGTTWRNMPTFKVEVLYFNAQFGVRLRD